MLDYYELMASLGLSQHRHQLQRRMQKYPKHIIEKDNVVLVSKTLANYISTAHWMQQECKALKKGGKDVN